jgi:epoxyqueuosine reductase QueG
VCPFSRKFSTPTAETAFWPREGVHGAELTELMSLSQEEFSRRHKGAAVNRTKHRALLRNVAVALGNWLAGGGAGAGGGAHRRGAAVAGARSVGAGADRV